MPKFLGPSFAALLSIWVAEASAHACDPRGIPFGGGGGTAAAPYLICSPEQFLRLATLSGRYARLAADINLSGRTLSAPLGTFSGFLNGAGFTIIGLRMVFDEASRIPLHPLDRAGSIHQRWGLFTNVSYGSRVESLRFRTPFLQVNQMGFNHSSRVGLLAGECGGAVEGVTVDPVVSSSIVSGVRYLPGLNIEANVGGRNVLPGYEVVAGGICGLVTRTGTIRGSSIVAAVSVNEAAPLVSSPVRVVAGGLAGRCQGNSLMNNRFAGRVRAVNRPQPARHAVGGICGDAEEVMASGQTVYSASGSETVLSLNEGSIGGIFGSAQRVQLSASGVQGTVVSDVREDVEPVAVQAKMGGAIGYLTGVSVLTGINSTAQLRGKSAVAAGGIVGEIFGRFANDIRVEASRFDGSIQLDTPVGASLGRKVGGIVGMVYSDLRLLKVAVSGPLSAVRSNMLTAPLARDASAVGGIVGDYQAAPPAGFSAVSGSDLRLNVVQAYFSGRLASEGWAGGVLGVARAGNYQFEDVLIRAVFACQPALAAVQRIGGLVGGGGAPRENSSRAAISIGFENTVGTSVVACSQFLPIHGSSRAGYTVPIVDAVLDEPRARLSTAAQRTSVPPERLRLASSAEFASEPTFRYFDFSTVWSAPRPDSPIALRWLIPTVPTLVLPKGTLPITPVGGVIPRF